MAGDTSAAAGYLQQTGEALSEPLTNLGQKFLEVTPGIIGGVLIVVFGYILGSLLGALTHALLNATRIDDHLKKARLAHSIGFISIASLGGAMVKWFTFALFIVEAADKFRLGVLSTQLARVAELIPQVFMAVLLVLGGLIIADYIADRMLHAKRKGVRFSSSVVRWTIIIIALITALGEIGVDTTLLSGAVLIGIASAGAALAVAVGIGFGLAMKDEAKGMIKHWKKNW